MLKNRYDEHYSFDNHPEKIKTGKRNIYITCTKANRIWVENEADLISSEEIGEVVNSIFEHFKIVSGNIFKLPFTLKL